MAFEDGEPNQLLENVKEVIKETLNYLTEKDIKNITYRDRDLLITYANEEIDGDTYAQKMMELTTSAQNENDD